MGEIRVRFAPAPTGYLHIGGTRTALFNWLYARGKKGKFILRIEDTDQTRSTEEAVNNIIESLKWLGLSWDEGPYLQTERREIYEKYAQKLVKESKAYYEGKAIKFRMPLEKIKILDLIHGEIIFDTQLLDDLVIMKSDGSPTYNFACVIDDALMKISCVIRGDDHLSNTPKQITLYKALNFAPPQYAHLPMILGPDHSPLSKRHGAVAVNQYQEKGYLPEAVLNYLALLGWGTPESQQIFSLEELINKFSLSRVSKSPAVFDEKKLTWLNGRYIKQATKTRILNLVIEHLKKKGYLKGTINVEKQNWIAKIIEVVGDRLKYISQIEDYADFFFLKKVKFNQEALNKILEQTYVPSVLKKVKEKFETLKSFNGENIEKILREIAQEFNLKNGEVLHPLRIALTGKMVTPPLFETMILLGKETTIQRIGEAINLL